MFAGFGKIAGRCRRSLLGTARLLCVLAAFSGIVDIREASGQTPFDQAQQMIAEGDYAGAEDTLKKNRFSGREAVPAAYLLAVVYARTGRLAEAEKLLREIVARDPSLDPVRSELVRVLISQGKREAAGYHINRLADAADLGEDRGRLERLSRQLGTREGFSFGTWFSLAPSTNINNGTSSSTINVGAVPFKINRNARQKSGIGVKGGVSAGYNHVLSETLSTYATLTLGATEYANEGFDTQYSEMRVGIRRNELGSQLLAEFIGDRQFAGWKGSSSALGGRVSAKWNLSPGWWLSGEVLYMHRSYDNDNAATAFTTRTTGSLRRAFAPGLALTLGGGYEREVVADRPWFSYRSFHALGGIETPIGHGIQMTASVKAGIRKFDELFPGATHAREDKFYEVRAAFQKNNFQIAGFSPVLSVFYKDQESDIALYRYTSSGVELTFTRAF